ncbi:MAG: DUF1800 domain-containing protein [Elusimicrobia bacterium]|nr:DUF1800 domain-containing protein [Elusimicrobiota bacterium]
MTTLAAVLAALLSVPAAARTAAAAPPPRMSARERALHALERLGYGPRPGEVEAVERLGVDKWVAAQLDPASVPDAALEERLKAYPSLAMTGEQLMDAYPNMKRKRLLGMFGSSKPPRDVAWDLASAKLLRAVYSERQLQEVLTDFWFNHFNVSAAKNQDRWLIIPYERDVIRPRVFGKFRDLLGAVAHSPAMLVYLDNFQSTIDARYAPAGAQEDIAEMEGAMARNPKGRRKLGLNENYARELLELHTLGVDGGYTQKDVTELARILTGWTVERPNPKTKDKAADWVFRFKRRMHDPGEKTLLGETYAWAGEAEGEKALDALARHPATARFVALKLCRRFVADDPPQDLVDAVARRFTETDGDLRETYRALFESDWFWERRWFRKKVKTPLEFVASALRATGAEVRDPERVARSLDGLGMPLYRCEPPTGWPDRAEAWVNAGALVSRLRAAQSLFSGNPNAPAAASAAADGADPSDGRALVARLTDAYLGGVVSEHTRDALFRRLEDPEVSRARLDDRRRSFRVDRLAALVLGSPDFQRR